MGQPKVIGAIVGTIVLAIVAYMANPVLGVLVLVLGVAGTVVLLRQGGAVVLRRDDADFLTAEDDDQASFGGGLDGGALPTWGTVEAEPLSTWDAGAAVDDAPLGTWSPEPATAEPLGSWDGGSDTLTAWEPEAPAAPVVDEAQEIAVAASLISSPINEEVSSADDIMAASEATELQIEDASGEDSELAKLLAKVQARLAAYE